MSKKEWKRMRRGLQVAAELEPVDAYGFDQTERLMLAQEGWTDHDLDFCIAEDFTPHEILEAVTLGLKPSDIHKGISMYWSPDEILNEARMNAQLNDDVPVADRRLM
jgi:hypothetical protein